MERMKEPIIFSRIQEHTQAAVCNFIRFVEEHPMQWLLSYVDEARKTLLSDDHKYVLPKTPGVKRKRNACNSQFDMDSSPILAVNHASTFVDHKTENETKRMKIDISAIKSDHGQIKMKGVRRSRTSAARKQPVRQSKRLAAVQHCSDLRKQQADNGVESVESPFVKNNVGTVMTVKESVALPTQSCKVTFTAPFTDNTEKAKSKNDVVSFAAALNPVEQMSSTNSHIKIANDKSAVHQMQPKIAALIGKLVQSSKKPNYAPAESQGHCVGRQDLRNYAKESAVSEPCKVQLFSHEEKDTEKENKAKLSSDNNKPSTISTDCCQLNAKVAEDQQDANALSSIEEGEGPSLDERVSYSISDPSTPANKLNMQYPEGTYIKSVQIPIDLETPAQSAPTHKSLEDLERDSADNVDDFRCLNGDVEDVCKEAVDEEATRSNGMLGTPHLQSAQAVHRTVERLISGDSSSPVVANEASAGSLFESDAAHKGPRIVKPIKAGAAGNIVVGVKSFIKRPETPNKETEEEKQKKREAEMALKEKTRTKVVEESQMKRQQLLEERRRLREEREKRFAEAHARRLEEEEKKKKYLELKAAKVSQNRELLKQRKEIEDKLKRKARDEKVAEVEARRRREEDEQRRKLDEQLAEEQRREEFLLRKAEYEERERQRRIADQLRLEKERLRQVEEERLMEEDRKRREFEDKEKHRLEVERKLKEEKEKEKIDKLQREERMRQAEREIEAAKRVEEEKERARQMLREQVKKQVHAVKMGAATNGQTPPSKVLVDVKALAAVASAPASDKENFKSPCSSAAPVLSPAAAKVPKKRTTLVYDPPKVPLVARQSSYSTYNIDNLNSDDSTDDECEPAQRVPSWAQGADLQRQLVLQFYTNVNPDEIFVGCQDECRLDKIFAKRKERYFKRTSSAHWTSPPVYKQRSAKVF